MGVECLRSAAAVKQGPTVLCTAASHVDGFSQLPLQLTYSSGPCCPCVPVSWPCPQYLPCLNPGHPWNPYPCGPASVGPLDRATFCKHACAHPPPAPSCCAPVAPTFPAHP